MRLSNRPGFFLGYGKNIFNKKSSSDIPDDSVKNEEKQALLENSEDENSASAFSRNNLSVIEEEIIDIGKKLHPLLAEFRKYTEEGRSFPNSRNWVDNALHTLGKCIQIAHERNQSDLERVFLDIARILCSYDRVGKAYYSISYISELYSLLCCIVGDFVSGKPYKITFSRWSQIYGDVVRKVTESGVRLIEDEEEGMISATEEGAPSDTFADTNPSPQTTDSVEVAQSAESVTIPAEQEKISEQKEDKPISVGEFDKNDVMSAEPIEEETKSVSTAKEAEIFTQSVVDVADTRTCRNEIEIENTRTPTASTLTNEHLDTDKLLKAIEKLPYDFVKQVVFETLQAIAKGSPEDARMKAIQLALTMAKVEVEKSVKNYKATEYQIESLQVEIESVLKSIQTCEMEMTQTRNELKKTEDEWQITTQLEEQLHKEIQDIQQQIEQIEKRIQELIQQKEQQISFLAQKNQDATLTSQQKEDLERAIQSLRETLQDIETQKSTLHAREKQLETIKQERQAILQKQAEEIRKREKTVQRLEETYNLLWKELSNIADPSASLEHPTPDLFKEE